VARQQENSAGEQRLAVLLPLGCHGSRAARDDLFSVEEHLHLRLQRGLTARRVDSGVVDRNAVRDRLAGSKRTAGRRSEDTRAITGQ
jgi:hypothetical protein